MAGKEQEDAETSWENEGGASPPEPNEKTAQSVEIPEMPGSRGRKVAQNTRGQRRASFGWRALLWRKRTR
jgi:hypothetical protein